MDKNVPAVYLWECKKCELERESTKKMMSQSGDKVGFDRMLQMLNKRMETSSKELYSVVKDQKMSVSQRSDHG